MLRPYKTPEGTFVKSNNPMPDWQPLFIKDKDETPKNYDARCEAEYIRLRDERNAETAEQDRIREEQMRPERERRKKIWDYALASAEADLIAKGEIDG